MEHPDPVAGPAPARRDSPSLMAVITLLLLIVGGINWALVGLFNVDLVAALFGWMSAVSRIVYVAVGVAALYALTLLRQLAAPG